MKNYLSFKDFDNVALSRAGLTANDIDPATRRVYINNALSKVYAYLKAVNDPHYNRTAKLEISQDTDADPSEEIEGVNTGGIISSINTTKKTITRTEGEFIQGSVVHIELYSNDIDNPDDTFELLLTSGGATAFYKVISGTEVGYDPDESGGPSLTGYIRYAWYEYYADVDDLGLEHVYTIYDHRGSKNTPRLFKEVADPVLFKKTHKNPFYDSYIAYHQRGEVIAFKRGACAVAFESPVVCEFRGRPAFFTPQTLLNIIDIPAEQNGVLSDEVVAAYLEHVQKPVPEAVADRRGEFSEQLEAKLQELQKNESDKGKRG